MDRTLCREAIHVSLLAAAEGCIKGVVAYIMDPTANIIAVSSQRVTDNGAHGAQIRKAAPQSIKGGDMGAMQLSGAAGPKTFSWIVACPEVQVAHLRTVWR